jgi:hypothetical protein
MFFVVHLKEEKKNIAHFKYNLKKAANWPVYRAASDQLMILNDPLKVASFKDINKDQNCALFDKVGVPLAIDCILY